MDAWPLAIQAFARNFPNAMALQLNLTAATGPKELGNIGKVDLILASPECTHHTCARGNRPREEASRETANYALSFAGNLRPRPRWIVIENVVHMRSWSGYNTLLAGMRSLGYRSRVFELDASKFGVPQTRRRVFILGDLNADPPERIPMRRGRSRTVKSILDKPGTWKSQPLRSERRAKATMERAERAIQALPDGESFLLVYYGSDGAGGWQPLDRPLRTITTLDRFGLVTWEGATPMLRMLQVPELMRAMGFEGSYDISEIGQRRDRIKLLGNGVCPPVMQAIVKALTSDRTVKRPVDAHQLDFLVDYAIAAE